MQYYPRIDGLRAVAVVPVVAVHCWSALLPGGGLGVDLFFVISGFVITTVLLAEFAETGRISIKEFYLRRAFRILPALIATCAVVSLFIIALTAFAPDLGGLRKFATVAAALTSTMNWARAFDITGGGMLGHTWSLSVEEQFYLFWPLALGLALRRGVSRTTILRWTIGAVVIVFLWRSALLANGASFARIANGTDTRMDEIALGCALALWPSRTTGNILGKLWLIPTVALLGCMTFSRYADPVLYQGAYAAIMLSSAWLIMLARDADVSALGFLQSKPFLWIGKRSYSMYLWHFPLIVGLEILGYVGPATRLGCFLATFVLGAASYEFIERPFLALRRKMHTAPQLPA